MTSAVVLVLLTATITPGPNNLVVMEAASRGRIAPALPAIAGIVIGTVGMVLAARLGLDALLARWADGEIVLRIIGAGLLALIGLRTVLSGWRAREADSRQASSTLFSSMLTLQVVNPKTWVLASAVGTTHAAAPRASLVGLAVATILVPTFSLLLWAAAGRSISVPLGRPAIRRAFATAMGTVLIAFAAFLLASGT